MAVRGTTRTARDIVKVIDPLDLERYVVSTFNESQRAANVLDFG